MIRLLFALLLAVTLLPLGERAAAQDVELLGRIYGTRPPDAYFQERQRPGAFEFERALTPRLHRALDTRRREGFDMIGASPVRTLGEGVPAQVILGPRVGSVQGRFRFPVIMGLYADSPESEPFPAADVQREFFSGPNSRYRTIPEYYAEVSGGRVQLEGLTFPWVRTGLTQAQVGGNVAGLTSASQLGQHIFQILRELDNSGVDWGQFDNDGPDGIPNSGDDDGFVDILIVMHPTVGGECIGGGRTSNNVWAHRWNLQARMGQTFATSTPSASGGPIRVNDYTIQSVYACSGDRIGEIGVMAHELGHGFGLPDLYNTGTTSLAGGVGNWDLMATGGWGCQGASAARPCHMGAWSKAVLGWADVVTLPAGVDHGLLTLPPVQPSGRILQLPASDGSGDFYLLENRQRSGFDEGLLAPGLLVWQIAPELIGDRLQSGSRWRTNTVNADRNRPAVWLRQADGREDLALAGTRGDSGDPFPGITGNRVFHAGSLPSSFSHRGTATGVTLLDIEEAGADVRFRLVNRLQQIRLRVEGGSGDAFRVDGRVFGSPHAFASAPFQRHQVEALPGVPLAPGERVGFQGWSDGGERVRTLVTELADLELVARYQGREFQLDLRPAGGAAGGPAPGTIEITGGTGDGWVAAGGTVSVRALPRTGFTFMEWTGGLSGRPNPASIRVDAPLTATARFEQIFAILLPPRMELEAATPLDLQLTTENGVAPISWTLAAGALPEGVTLWGDRVRGEAVESGTFSLTFGALDAEGLATTRTVQLVVTPPVIPVGHLLSAFLLTSGVPTDAQLRYLDRAGNRNGFYDLGDLRAFLLANPGLPMTMQDRGVLSGLGMPVPGGASASPMAPGGGR